MRCFVLDNLDVICEVDTIIDFGSGSGEVVVIDTPQEVAANKDSLTGQCLKAYLEL